MRYIYACVLSLLLATSIFAQTATTDTNPTGLRYNITEKPWAIHLDLTRLSYKIPSIQLSASYRPNFRFGFESELNYYLPTEAKNESKRPDAIHIGLSPKKMNWFVSGIGKVYFAQSKTQYIAFKLSSGTTSIDLSRKVCTKAEPATSGAICRCLQTETRELTVSNFNYIYGFRYGVDLPVTPNIRFNTFIDFSWYNQKLNDHQFLHHACDDPWKYYGDIPKTDGIFGEYQDNYDNFYFSVGVKLGYAF